MPGDQNTWYQTLKIIHTMAFTSLENNGRIYYTDTEYHPETAVYSQFDNLNWSLISQDNEFSIQNMSGSILSPLLPRVVVTGASKQILGTMKTLSALYLSNDEISSDNQHYISPAKMKSIELEKNCYH